MKPVLKLADLQAQQRVQEGKATPWVLQRGLCLTAGQEWEIRVWDNDWQSENQNTHLLHAVWIWGDNGEKKVIFRVWEIQGHIGFWKDGTKF